MGPKDYISIAAILIASASLFVSWRTATFTRRVKSGEVRVATLTKVSKLFAIIARAHHLQSEILVFAKARDDSETASLVDGLELEHVAKAIDRLHSKISEVPAASSVSVYEGFFHELDHLSAISREIQARLESNKAKLETQTPPSKA